LKTLVKPATPEAIAEAAAIIRAGGLVAFPTETVYGLGADATNPRAVARIYEAKQRALNDPLIVHVAVTHDLKDLTLRQAQGVIDLRRISSRQVNQVSQVDQVKRLMHAFWPGPLTLVLPRGASIPPNVSAGLDTVAVRMPDHPVAHALIQQAGVPIAAPSANRFGHVSPTLAQHVLDDLNGRIDMVLDGGPARIGVESTVLDMTGDAPRILRPGGVTREQIAERLEMRDWRLNGESPLQGRDAISNLQSPLPSPGMLEKHYSPKAQLMVCKDLDELIERQSSIVNRQLRVGVLLMAQQRGACEKMHPQFVLGNDLNDVARNLYAGLRALDGAGVDVILMTEVERAGIGEAIADRLQRAAAK
jgi:L-threonylcarbamoyladenylate synthase